MGDCTSYIHTKLWTTLPVKSTVHSVGECERQGSNTYSQNNCHGHEKARQILGFLAGQQS